MTTRKAHAHIYLVAFVMVFIIMSCPAISSASFGISRLTTQVTQTNESAFRYETGVTKYPWAQHCHDAQRTGFTQSPAPVSNHTLWKFDGDGKDFYISFPTVANGKVFLAVQVPLPYDHIYALDANTGEQIWAWRPEGLPVGSGFQASPVVDAGKLYFPTGTSLYCISAAEGDVMWKYDFGHSLGGTHSVAVSGGRIYGFSMNSVWCIETGYMTGYFPILKWETLSGGNFTIDPQYSGLIGSPAVGEGKVIGIGRGSGDVFCLNATTGQWKWTVHTGAITQYTPTIYGEKVYYGNNNGDLYCWNADTGQEIWKKHFSLGICWSPAVAYDNIYAGSYDGWFRAFNANTGALVWEINNTAAQASHPFLGYWGVWHAPPAVADHRVYMGGHDGYFYCWNASTGQELWKYKVGGDVCAGPAIADGRAYVGSHYIFSKLEGQGTGTFYCFGKGPTTTKVSTTASTVTNGTSTTILGALTDESSAHLGEAVEGVQVKLTYQTDGDWIDLATLTTSPNGDFSYEWAPSELGTYKIMAYFEGDNDYEWSASEVTFQVTSAPPLPEFPEYGTPDFPAYPVYPEYTTVDLFIIVAVIVAIVIGLYNTYVLRKK